MSRHEPPAGITLHERLSKITTYDQLASVQINDSGTKENFERL